MSQVGDVRARLGQPSATALRLLAAWAGNELMNRHTAARRLGTVSLYAAGRALRSLELAGKIERHGRANSARGQLWRRR